MGRWVPDARGRLERAAIELYLERGFDQTTVAEIAERAGLTKRTFFRHYADKRDVLFAGATILQDHVVTAVANAPSSASPLAAVVTGLDAATAMIQERGEAAWARRDVIDANPELQERETVKMATLAAAVASALVARGVDPFPARLAAEAGIAAFRVAFQRWGTAPDQPDLTELFHETLGELKTVLG